MNEFESIEQALLRHVEFLHQNSIVPDVVTSPTGFDLLSLPAGVPTQEVLEEACQDTDAKIRAAQGFDPAAATQLRLLVDQFETLLKDPSMAQEYAQWVGRQRQTTPSVAQAQPVQRLAAQPISVAPLPKNRFPFVAVFLSVILIGGLAATTLFKSHQPVTTGADHAVVVTAPRVDPAPPKPIVTADDLIKKSTQVLTDAKNANNDFNLGVLKMIQYDEKNKDRCLSWAKDALADLAEAKEKASFGPTLYPAFYWNRAYAKALLGMRFEDDIASTQTAMKSMPDGKERRTIETAVAWLISTLPQQGRPPKKKLWLR